MGNNGGEVVGYDLTCVKGEHLAEHGVHVVSSQGLHQVPGFKVLRVRCVILYFSSNVGYSLFLSLRCGEVGHFPNIFDRLCVPGVLCLEEQGHLSRG
jgi:hypothetical protein